jgi:oligosaccharyltransferase complex subunit epsilon
MPQILDLYCASALCTALVQFVYAFVVGTFPFNAFLAGFFCCVGSFVLTRKFFPLVPWMSFICDHFMTLVLVTRIAVSMRMQLSGKEGAKTSRERAFLNYTFAMTMLFLAVWCYIG